MKSILFIGAACILLTGCGFIAERMAPRKQPARERTATAIQADGLFWNTLHGSQFDQVPQALEAQTAAYLATPNDAVTAAHVGWLHIWRVSERRRLESVPATITDDIVLSHEYFQEAVALNPGDARYLGFLAAATLAAGDINQDERLTRRGYFMLLDAIKAWPEFNLFTAGYVMSTQPAGSARFKQALEWQWQNLEVCVGEKVDRKTAAYAGYMKLETRKGPKRVCWDSWIAPHNLEGFFLNMGDMLVKSGDWQTGRQVYENAKLPQSFGDWKYRQVLLDRIRDAPRNVAAFNAPLSNNSHGSTQIMAASSFACMACHQQ